MAKQRLDTLLVELNLCSSRQLAQRLIQAGEVRVNQQVVDKPGTEVQASAQIEIKERSPYVSRGGEKLAKALKLFNIAVEGRICLDGGISTGGFTDCLLQAGAKLLAHRSANANLLARIPHLRHKPILRQLAANNR